MGVVSVSVNSSSLSAEGVGRKQAVRQFNAKRDAVLKSQNKSAVRQQSLFVWQKTGSF